MKNWLASEPVRVYAYTVAVALAALLVTLGVVKSDQVPVILGVLGAVLSVGGGELVRSKVSPTIEKAAVESVDVPSVDMNDEPPVV